MSDEAITIIRNGEGFGSLYQCMMAGVAYCRYHNKKFIFTPARAVGHNVNPRYFNKFIGFKGDIKTCKKVKIMEFPREVHASDKPSIYYTDAVKKELREMYYSTPKPEKCKYDIAIHIRRGDVVQKKQIARFVTTSNYIDIIRMLKEKHPGFSICIFSEGRRKDFSCLDCFEDLNYILNGDPLVTFHNLVTAKVLVTARSSFSLSAGILNQGKIYHVPYCKHRPLDNWEVLEIIKDPEKVE